MRGIPIIDSLTVQVHTCLDTLGHETNSKLAVGTLHCQWCVGLRCDKLQLLCVLFYEVFCVKNCIYYISIMVR
jgi:hypothetical protein